MRRMIIAAGFCVFAMAAGAGPALAGYGALGRDDSTGKYGLSSNEETQSKADDVALKECGSDKCKFVFRTTPHECGAIATGEGPAWLSPSIVMVLGGVAAGVAVLMAAGPRFCPKSEMIWRGATERNGFGAATGFWPAVPVQTDVAR